MSQPRSSLFRPGTIAGGALWGALLLTPAGARSADEFFDLVEQRLTFASADGDLRARVSGTLDVEGYAFRPPAPWLLQTGGRTLFTPRLSTFVDAQWGPRLYAFVQARADRGFDPAQADGEVRLDEYALRVTPWLDSRLNVQVGKFATVVGSWAPRHGSWANPFITAPLPYESLTGIWDTEAVRSSTTLLQWSHIRAGQPPAVTAIEKSLRVPVLWGPSYALGAAVSGEIRRLNYAIEVKQASLSSRPEAWRNEGWEYPTVSGRLGFRPNQGWDLGVSASAGSYLRPFAAGSVAARRSPGDYRQIVLGHDIGFARGHLQLWAEIFAARFEIPRVGNADLISWYVEGKYKFTPQFFLALRWNQQWFDTIPHRGGRVAWGHEAWRFDVGPGYRFTSHDQLKLQYSVQRGDRPRPYDHTAAVQYTIRF